MRRFAARSILFLALAFAASGSGQQSSLLAPSPPAGSTRITLDGPAQAVAFGRYLASLQERNPFTEAGPIDVKIEASLPSLSKQASMWAVRETSASERTEYNAIHLEGDSMVKQQVIARYLAAQEQAEGLPYSSLAVTPANYKFRYVGSSQTGEAPVYIFQITPKKKRGGLIRGQIWIDPATGIAVHQEGRFVKRPSIFIRQLKVTRDTSLRDGLPYQRVTHVVVNTRMVGRAELTILECAVPAADVQEVQLLQQKTAE